jgi:hypothetical protein
MTLGAKVDTVANDSFTIELLASTDATNGAPSGAAGININDLRIGGRVPDKIRIGIKSTAGSGTMTVTLRLWARCGGDWLVHHSFAASPTAPQTAVAIAETSADAIAYSEIVSGLGRASRVYLEVVAIAGTATAVTGYAIVGRD